MNAEGLLGFQLFLGKQARLALYMGRLPFFNDHIGHIPRNTSVGRFAGNPPFDIVRFAAN